MCLKINKKWITIIFNYLIKHAIITMTSKFKKRMDNYKYDFKN